MQKVINQPPATSTRPAVVPEGYTGNDFNKWMRYILEQLNRR